jgi:hypothetical protein
MASRRECRRIGRDPARGGAFVGRLHQPRPAAGDDVAAHLRQPGRHPFGLFIGEGSRPHSRRTEDRYPITVVLGGLEPGQIVDHVPEPEDRVHQTLLHSFLVVQADRIGFWCLRIIRTHHSRSSNDKTPNRSLSFLIIGLDLIELRARAFLLPFVEPIPARANDTEIDFYRCTSISLSLAIG